MEKYNYSQIRPIDNKKGQVLNTVTATFVGLFVLILIGFAILLGIANLDTASFFDAGSAEANATTQATANLTQGFADFTANIPTIMTILGVVVILGALAILILVVVRVRQTSGASGAL